MKKERIEAFLGATLNCLKHHIKPSITKTPDRFVIHRGTNSLDSESTPEKIVNDITDLRNAVKMKKKKKKNKRICYSEICPRNDHFNQKTYKVNQLLAGKYGENGFNYITHNNIST